MKKFNIIVYITLSMLIIASCSTDPGLTGNLSKPQISVPSGIFETPQTVELSCAEPDVVIRYTMDGSDPTENSISYAGPIIIEDFTRLKAKSFKSGWDPSLTTYSEYKFCSAPSGEGTSDNPYNISTLKNLTWIVADSTRWKMHYNQVSNIDASQTQLWGDGLIGWSPIGDNSKEFSGSYNGCWHSIDGLFISSMHGPNGLFGNTKNASISNLNMVNTTITGGGACGPLVAACNASIVTNCNSSGTCILKMWSVGGGLIGISSGSSRISNCSSSVSLSNGGQCTGGLVGKNIDSRISWSTFTGKVNSTGEMAGGLVGANWGEYYTSSVVEYCKNMGIVSSTGDITGGLVGSNDSTIDECYNIGSVSGVSNVGGLVGVNYSYIRNCYNNSVVYGSGENVGGLIGTNHSGNASSVYFCFSKGTVNGGNAVAGLIGCHNGGYVGQCFSSGLVAGSRLDAATGGLIGVSYNGNLINISYWDVQTSGQSTSAAGEGRTTNEMTYPYSSNTYVGWSFDEHWFHDEDHSVNNGYPHLSLWVGWTSGKANSSLMHLKSI